MSKQIQINDTDRFMMEKKRVAKTLRCHVGPKIFFLFVNVKCNYILFVDENIQSIVK
jgi:hypothetical protein